jgi:adenylate cyclase
MDTLFLQEIDASVLLADVRDFTALVSQLAPVELGLALTRFYEHAGAIIESHHGRIVKFVGDAVLGVFVAQRAQEHRARVLAAVTALVRARQQFLDENAASRLPRLDYTVGAASGTVVAGELGTERLRFYDVLGGPVTRAFQLTSLAARRGAPALVDAATLQGVDAAQRPAAVATKDGFQIDG